MSRLAIPISGQVLWSTGDVRLWATIPLLLKDRTGSFVPEILLIDCASEISTFPAYHAHLLGLPLPAKAAPGVIHTQTGLEIRSGLLRFQILGMDQTEYATPCLFLGDPMVPPHPGRPATLPRKLLQPFALVDRLRFVIDKDPLAGSLYGDLIVEKK
jgi:hypothetical protein